MAGQGAPVPPPHDPTGPPTPVARGSAPPQPHQLVPGSSSSSSSRNSWICSFIRALRGTDPMWGPCNPPGKVGNPLPSHPSPTCSSCAGLRCARRTAAWRGGPVGQQDDGDRSPVPNLPRPQCAPPGPGGGSPLMPHHFLEGEAAAVAQQGDEGSSAVSPVGRGMVSGDGGPGTSTVSPVPPPCPQPRHRAPTASPNSHLPIPCLLRHQRGLQGQLLLCQRATWGHGHTLRVRGHPPMCPQKPLTHPHRCPGRRGRAGSAAARCSPRRGLCSASRLSCGHTEWVRGGTLPVCVSPTP